MSVMARIHHLVVSDDKSLGRKLASLEGIPLDVMHLIANFSSVEDLAALRNVGLRIIPAPLA